jgi:hypothetical protein
MIGPSIGTAPARPHVSATGRIPAGAASCPDDRFTPDEEPAPHSPVS